MSRIAEITMRRLRVPLTVPYKVSLRTFTHFEPIVAEICDADGRVGWGEAEIHRGYGQRRRNPAGITALPWHRDCSASTSPPPRT
jgi:L-Ala-D/L-Glu epimerase